MQKSTMPKETQLGMQQMISVFGRISPFESLLFAVALAVELTPEFLPMIITVTKE